MLKLAGSVGLAIALVFLAVTAIGCKGGGGSAADDESRQISDEELSRMMLSLGLFGQEYAGFAPGADNGIRNLETASQDDFDPAGERADLEGGGFASGYETYYSSNAGAPGGTFFLGSQVALFQTVDGAKRYFDDSSSEVTGDIGKTNGNVTLVEAEKLAFEGITADQSLGVRGVARFAQADGSTTDVWIVASEYRRGRLLGGVAMYARNPSDLEKQRLEGTVETLGQVMNQQMETVLAAGGATGAPAAADQ